MSAAVCTRSRNNKVKIGDEIRNDFLPLLKADGIDLDKERVVRFCNISNRDVEKRTISQKSPFHSSDTDLKGTTSALQPFEALVLEAAPAVGR